ncbi:hypothetical protein HYFRA_00004924 [Hymenoscyphus fraxineus]|uniref:Uncharacterized protein n=1 Tax=Hymenoscyphus fraxineus TaxID=746836 RepID=A0A9N9KL59_9HELO|nr:hypothetical protein HYFRA_00004924 [Hymenoscyphus fraxineus]
MYGDSIPNGHSKDNPIAAPISSGTFLPEKSALTKIPGLPVALRNSGYFRASLGLDLVVAANVTDDISSDEE